jgi:protein phosphatase
MTEPLQTRSSRSTHPGQRRVNNEDFVDSYEPTVPDELIANGCLYIVADGVGGAAHGEQASKYATQKVLFDYYQPSQLTPPERLEQAMLAANHDIYTYSHSEEVLAQMATTMVAAVVINNQLYVANVGDSPAYLIRADRIIEVSQEHSLVGERVRDGSMTEEEARISPIKNRITRSLGGEANVHVFVSQPQPLQPGDRIVLCSDGVTRYATREDIVRLAGSGTPEDAVHKLIDFANQEGGADNITAVVVVIEPPSAVANTIPIHSVRQLKRPADIDTENPDMPARQQPKDRAVVMSNKPPVTKLPMAYDKLLMGGVALVLVFVIGFAILLGSGSALSLSLTATFMAITRPPTSSATATLSPTFATQTPTPSATATPSLAATITPTSSGTATASLTATILTPTPSVTVTASLTATILTPTPTVVITETPGGKECLLQVKSGDTMGKIKSSILSNVDRQVEITLYYYPCELTDNNLKRCLNLTKINQNTVILGTWLVIPIQENECTKIGGILYSPK